MPRFLLIGMFLVAAVTAHAVTPVVTTTAATGVTDSDAALNGTIDPLGEIFEVRAEYGLTASYGYITQGSSNFWGNGLQACAFHPSGLATNTTYHFRIVAKTLDGASTYVGNDMTFTTLANLPTVGTAVAGVSNLAASEVNFGLNSLRSGSSKTTVSYEYGLTASYGFVVVSPTQVDKDSLAYTTCFAKATGLAQGTKYHFRAKAVNDQGTVYSVDDTFTTAVGPELVTTAATGVTDLVAVLNGTVLTNGVPLIAYIEYGVTTDYGQELVAASGILNNSSAVPVSVQPQGLLPATTYHYRVKAKYYWDQSYVYCGEDQTFTTGVAATKPTAGRVWGESVGFTEARVYCSPIFSGSSTTTAVFQYGLTTAYGSSTAADGDIAVNVSGPTLSADLSGLAPGATYHLRCVLTNAEGSVSSADATFTTGTPPTVTTVAATSVGDLSAVLNCTVDATGSPTSGRIMFELGTSTAYGTDLDVTSGVGGVFSLNVKDLLPGTTYHYRAKVYFPILAGINYYGSDMTFTTAAPNTPPIVGNVSCTLVTTSKAILSVSGINPGSSDASIFWEYQAEGGAVQSVPGDPPTRALGLGTAPAGITLSQLLPGTTYSFRCGVTNGQGTSYSASSVFATLSGPTLTVAAATSVADVSAVLNGSASSNGYSIYILYFDLGKTTDYGVTFTPSGNYLTGTSTLSSAASHLLPNTTYHYRLRAEEVISISGRPVLTGTSYNSADQTFTTGPAATPPTATTTSASALAPTAATLNASFETGSSESTVVFEYGQTTAYGSQCSVPVSYEPSAAAVATYALLGLTANTTYHYRVIVTNGEGSSTGQDVSFTTVPVPTVTTGAASFITDTRTTLNGTCNKQGGTYTVTFDYGPTTNYGLTATLAGGRPIIIFPGGGGGGLSPDVSVQVGSLLPLTTYHFRLKATDNYGNSYSGSDATFVTMSPVQAWRQARFSTVSDTGSAADMATPAGDGIPNLLKYALGMEPATVSREPQPQLKDYSGAQHLSLTFSRDPTKTDLIYEVQAADSPSGPWTTVASSSGGAAVSGPGLVEEVSTGFTITPYPIQNGVVGLPPPVNVEVKDTVSMQDAPRRFMRLRVTRQ